MGFLDNLRSGIEEMNRANENKMNQMIMKMPNEGILHNMNNASNPIAREKCREEARRRGLI